MFGTVPLSSVVTIWKSSPFGVSIALCSRGNVTPLPKVVLILRK